MIIATTQMKGWSRDIITPERLHAGEQASLQHVAYIIDAGMLAIEA
jgi:hypothetical protein